MLQTLRNIPESDAQKVLVVLSEMLLPRPFDNPYSFDIDSNLILSTQQEIEKRTYTKWGDNSDKSRGKVLDLLSRELNNSILTGNKREKALERIGQAGVLPIKDYKLKFTKFFDYYESLGVQKSHVKNALENPVQYYHDENPLIPMTLFMSFVENRNDSYYLLCVAQRSKKSLLLDCALRIYTSDFDINGQYSLKKILEIFLMKFGVEMDFLNQYKGLFFDYIFISNFNSFQAYFRTPRLLLKEKNNDEIKFSLSAGIKRSFSNTLEIWYLFLLDISKYHAYLENHDGLHNFYNWHSNNKFGTFFEQNDDF